MKIAILNIYQKTATRGAETYIRELAYELSKRNEVEVFSGDWASEERWPVLWRLFLDPKSASIALFTLKLLPTLLKNRFDIVMPTNGGWQPAFVRIATWIYGGKMVIPISNDIVYIKKKKENDFYEEKYYGFAFVPLVRDKDS